MQGLHLRLGEQRGVSLFLFRVSSSQVRTAVDGSEGATLSHKGSHARAAPRCPRHATKEQPPPPAAAQALACRPRHTAQPRELGSGAAPPRRRAGSCAGLLVMRRRRRDLGRRRRRRQRRWARRADGRRRGRVRRTGRRRRGGGSGGQRGRRRRGGTRGGGQMTERPRLTWRVGAAVNAQWRDQRRMVGLARAARRVGSADKAVAVEVDLRDDGLMAGRLQGVGGWGVGEIRLFGPQWGRASS